MSVSPRVRQQKLIEAIHSNFTMLAHSFGPDSTVLSICQHLIATGDGAIDEGAGKQFIAYWHEAHPEEDILTCKELIESLEIVEVDMRQQARSAEVKLTISQDSSAMLRVINGGLSANPDIPYTGEKDIVDY